MMDMYFEREVPKSPCCKARIDWVEKTIVDISDGNNLFQISMPNYICSKCKKEIIGENND